MTTAARRARPGRSRDRKRVTSATRRSRSATRSTDATRSAEAVRSHEATRSGDGKSADAASGTATGRDPALRWFAPSSAHPVRTGSSVDAFVDGDSYFADLAAQVRRTQGDADFVLLADWDLRIDFELVPGDPTSTVARLLADASARGVVVRALLNLHQSNPFGPGTVTGYDNTFAAQFIAGLPTGAAVHDDRYLYAGTHHQKLAVVASAAGLVAYSGGMDLNPNRLTSWNGLVRHDVQVRVTGPAAHDHYEVFADRWSEHPGAVGVPLPPVPGPVEPTGTLTTQVVCTYGNGRRRGGIAPAPGSTTPGYSFAPSGDRSVSDLVEGAIRSARRFVYVEDQYLVNPTVSAWLLAALPRIEHLVVVVPPTAAVNRDLIQGWRRRRAFVAPLLAAAPEKVSVCVATDYYVHSKLWIVDDELAVVGSANCNRRGYTHDSEQAVGIVDTAGQGRWVRELRATLWAKHLGLSPADLLDPLEAARHWRDLPPTARVATYDPAGGVDNAPFPRGTDFFWDSIIDPDGF